MSIIDEIGQEAGSPFPQYVDMICTVCRHCDMGPTCTNCEINGREKAWMRPLTYVDRFGGPSQEPLFYIMHDGTTVPNSGA